MPTPAEIRSARDRVGMSQSEAAAIKGWTRDYWAKLEAGKREISALDWAHWRHLAGIERLPFRAARSASE